MTLDIEQRKFYEWLICFLRALVQPLMSYFWAIFFLEYNL